MADASRTSHEVRGLKCKAAVVVQKQDYMSHLTRGAWIEICGHMSLYSLSVGRTSHEVRGLKYRYRIPSLLVQLVAPHTRCVD